MKSCAASFAVVFLLATLSACVPHRPDIVNAYSGAEKLASQLAKVSCVNLEVKAINGNTVTGDGKTKYSDQGTGTCGVNLLPGTHQIRLAYAQYGRHGVTSGVWRSKRDKTIKVRLDGGREYTFWGFESKEPADKGWKIAIIDLSKSPNPNPDPNASPLEVPFTLVN